MSKALHALPAKKKKKKLEVVVKFGAVVLETRMRGRCGETTLTILSISCRKNSSASCYRDCSGRIKPLTEQHE